MDELVKRLREPCQYENCILCQQAADAIEELNKDLERSKEWEKFWEKEANEALKNFQTTVAKIPHWIPVAERLPKDGVFVLVCNDDGHIMIAKHESETYEWYYKYTNYDFDIWDNEEQGPVCYWMPLPEPPKEE